MSPDVQALLEECHFPPPGTRVELAVSGGPDSLGLLLLSRAQGLEVSVHHVDHHARPTSGFDADFVRQVCARLDVTCVVHDVAVAPSANFESRARSARRAAMPTGVMTGHTMDDLVETVLLNMLRGAGVDGMSPMVADSSKPLIDLRRAKLLEFVVASEFAPRHDESNDSPAFQRNRVRHELLVLMGDIAQRDVVPVIARQALLMHDERVWLDELSRDDRPTDLASADCRVVGQWPTARLRRWLREKLRSSDEGDGTHPPSAHEVDRALRVVRGEAVATEISGGRRLARRDQHLTLE